MGMGRVLSILVSGWFLALPVMSAAEVMVEQPISTENFLVGQTAQKSWAQLELRSYVYTVEHRCHCGVPSPAKVFVEGDRVVRVQGVGSEIVHNSRYVLAGFHSMPGYFELLKKIYEKLPFNVLVKLNDSLGYPELIDIDLASALVDDEIFYRITDVKALVPAK